MTVVPPAIPIVSATPGTTSTDAGIKMEVNGAQIVSAPGSNAPTVVQWPGAGGGRAAITVTSDQGQQPAVIERSGWMLANSKGTVVSISARTVRIAGP